MKEVRPGQPIVVGEMTITPLERVESYHDSGRKGFWVYVYKEPVGIVIDSPKGIQTVTLSGQDMPIGADILGMSAKGIAGVARTPL